MTIYSVKADVRDGAGFCHVFMTRDKNGAIRKAREIERDMSLGICRLAKVVRPAQWVIDGYVAAGNSIG